MHLFLGGKDTRRGEKAHSQANKHFAKRLEDYLPQSKTVAA